MVNLMLALMVVITICACAGLGTWAASIGSQNRRLVAWSKIFGGLSYTLLGACGLVVRNGLSGAQSLYLPVLSIAFIALGTWMLRTGLKARRAQ